MPIPTRTLAFLALAAFAVPSSAQLNTYTPYGAYSNSVMYRFGYPGDTALDTHGGPGSLSASSTAAVTYGSTTASGGALGFSLHSSSVAHPFSEWSTTGIQGGTEVTVWDSVDLTNDNDYAVNIPLNVAFDGFVTDHAAASYGLKITGYSDGYGYENALLQDGFDGSQGAAPAGGAYRYSNQGTELSLAPHTGYAHFHFVAWLDTFVSTDANTDHDVFADFGNTMKLQWDLPAGVGYTSASNVFSPGAIAPVPEPAPMLALGVGAAGLLRRRRKA